MLDQKVIVPSDSPWSSPVILVKKKTDDGKPSSGVGPDDFRMCIDYRNLNSVTKKDSYPLPLIAEAIDSIGSSKAQFFTSLDIRSSYHQIEIDDFSKPKTSFVTHSGLFSFETVPYGLTNAHSLFQRAMELSLRGHQYKFLLIYIDDILYENTKVRTPRVSEYNVCISNNYCTLRD
jgi:hypothetical protein